ncbi:MAG: DJ-1/PfpI family protein [Bacteroidales bacterium]|nr:DJ-1/PfpI family protein [Bacteroidales bacterium]
MKNNILIFALLLSLFACQNVETNNIETTTKLKVAVFNGNGAGAISVIETIEALKIDQGIDALAISAAQIQAGELSNFDVLVFPGGSGSKELNNLGEKGNDIVHDFIKEDGKGIVGICAGGYLLSSTDSYPSLDIANSKHIDRDHYNRGRGLVEFTLSSEGYAIFPELKNHRMFAQYYDGPVLAPNDITIESYTEIAQYVTDIHPDNFAPSGITPGKTFSLTETVGKGKVFIIAGHPESTPGMRWLVPRMARWVSNSELVSYNKQWVRPELNDTTILFTRALKKSEKQAFWKLFDENATVQIQAMDYLHSLRSRPAVRWNIGLLRSNKAAIRKHAAELLQSTEYTYAIPDLEEALKKETNAEAKKSMEEALKFLAM